MQSIVRHVDPMGVSTSVLPHEISPTSIHPHPLHASEEGDGESTLRNTVAESLFSTGVNLLGLKELGQDKSVNPSLDGVPPQRRHVVYEYDNGLFVSRALHNELILKEKEMLERVNAAEGRHHLSPVKTMVASRNSGNNRPLMMDARRYSQRAEEFRAIVQRSLKYMRRIETIFTAFAAGASLLSLLIVRVGNRQDVPLDDPVLLYFAIVYNFNGSLFLFLFLLLLITSLAPFAFGLANNQWRHIRRRQRSHSSDNDSQIQLTQQRRRRVEPIIRQRANVRFADQHKGFEETPFSTFDTGRNSVLTESLPLSVVGGTKGESIVAMPYSTTAASIAPSPPIAVSGSGSGSGGDGAIVKGTGRRRMRSFTPGDNTLARRLLPRSWSNPWRVLLVPAVWLHTAGLVLTVVEIAFTEGRGMSELLALRRNDHSVVATGLLTVLCTRTAILLLALLVELFHSER
ncbi:hypothetical protein LSM04_007677 [Trypanosoma melophagium]|uniref:uncharacterized protein n=1 Tax=Trypanosoma melophagium TaxID=715481 RepID=UPI00351A4F3C|nr:hypothetical protein LSM04_007677 [Trypanosoma melophagium]